jgi:hypothetical protein
MRLLRWLLLLQLQLLRVPLLVGSSTRLR